MESTAETETMVHAAAAAAPHSATITRPGADSGGGGDEEEARLWAALERLPTAQRARSAIVDDDGAGGKAMVDVGDLGLAQRRALLDRLVGSVDRDNEGFLLKLRERIDRRNKVLIHELSTPPAGSSDLHFSSMHSRSFFTQCLACLWKQNLSYWRNPQYNAVRFFFTSIIALLFGTIFWGIGAKREKPQYLFNAMGSMYAAVLTMGVLNAATVQPVVSVERMAFYRERAAGMYSAFPYAFGQVLIEFPYTLVQTCIYCVIVYAMMGFKWTVAKFFWNLFFMYFTLLYFTFSGMMAIGSTQNPNVASILSAALHATWNLFSGFLIPQTKIPIWWRWYYWLCPVAWSLYGMVVSQYGDDVESPLFDSVTNTTVANFVKGYFGFDHSFLGVIAAGVVAFGLLFALLFGVALMKLNFQRK